MGSDKLRMMPLPLVRRLTLACALTFALSMPVLAQTIPETGGRVFGQVGGSFGDGASSVLTSGGAGVRLTRHLGLDFEIFHVTGLALMGDGQPGFVLTDLFGIARDGDLTAFVSRFTVDFPVDDRVIPYLSGGGGVGQLSETIRFDVGRFGEPTPFLDLPAHLPGNFPFILPEMSQTGLVLTVGGGVDVRLWKGFSVGGEVRWLRLLASRGDFDFAHVLSRVSYRF